MGHTLKGTPMDNQPQTAALRAFFYLLESEVMPPDADDAWFLQPCTGVRDAASVEAFARGATAIVADLPGTDSTEEAVQALFYAHAKQAFGEDKDSIRRFFAMLYLLLFGRDHGPRWGQFVTIVGVDLFCARVSALLADPFGPGAPLFPPH
jgi:hypothetical protein